MAYTELMIAGATGSLSKVLPDRLLWVGTQQLRVGQEEAEQPSRYVGTSAEASLKAVGALPMHVSTGEEPYTLKGRL